MTAPRFNHCELSGVTGGRWIGNTPREVTGVGIDTRKFTPGALFVAIKGERFDGHDFVAAAAQAGAAAAVVAEDRAAALGEPGLPLLAVPDTLAALGSLARFHRLRFDLPVVAVTGSNGKTTTREMIAAILARRGRTLKNEGNLNNEIGVPLTLFGLDEGHAAAVIEMGMSGAGEIARLAGIARPQIGVVTNAGAAHLEGLGTDRRRRRREGGALRWAPSGRRRHRQRRRRRACSSARRPAAGACSPSRRAGNGAATWWSSRSSSSAPGGCASCSASATARSRSSCRSSAPTTPPTPPPPPRPQSRSAAPTVRSWPACATSGRWGAACASSGSRAGSS